MDDGVDPKAETEPLPVDDYFMTIAILSQELSHNVNKVSPLHITGNFCTVQNFIKMVPCY